MNPFAITAVALLAGMVPCGLVLLRGTLVEAVAAVEVAGLLTIMVLLAMAEALARSALSDAALLLAALLFGGGLVFVHAAEHWV